MKGISFGAEKWRLKKKNRQKSLKPEAEKWRLDCN
jgi:hypothetical protein